MGFQCLYDQDPLPRKWTMYITSVVIHLPFPSSPSGTTIFKQSPQICEGPNWQAAQALMLQKTLPLMARLDSAGTANAGTFSIGV